MHTWNVETDPSPDAPPRVRTADVVISMVLVCVHIGLALVMSFVAPFLAMTTDQCAYQACGDEQWVNRAIYTAWGGSAVAVLVDAAITGALLAKGRPAFYVPILGCLLQVGLGVLVVYLVSLAGAIT